MKRSRLAVFLLMLGLALAASGPAAAQQQNPNPERAYRLTFYLSEAAAGKPAVVHDFQMLLSESSSSNRIHTGEQVPVSTSPDHHSYQNIGTELICRLVEGNGDGVTLNVALDATRVTEGGGGGALPTIGTASVRLQTAVGLGGKVKLAEFEDAASHTKYQLAVVAEAER
jgi:hypothetical protein